MLLNKGKYGDKQVLSEAAVEQMMTIHSQPAQIRFAPKSLTGYSYALGSWAIEEKNGKATGVINPGFQGTWPVVDLCRGYALLVVPKESEDEQKPEIFAELKTIVIAWLDAIHNASMILSGMGPVVEIKTTAGKWFSSFYALFSGIVFITNIGILLAPVMHRIFHRLHMEDH
jgi:hypothetical protein